MRLQCRLWVEKNPLRAWSTLYERLKKRRGWSREDNLWHDFNSLPPRKIQEATGPRCTRDFPLIIGTCGNDSSHERGTSPAREVPFVSALSASLIVLIVNALDKIRGPARQGFNSSRNPRQPSSVTSAVDETIPRDVHLLPTWARETCLSARHHWLTCTLALYGAASLAHYDNGPYHLTAWKFTVWTYVSLRDPMRTATPVPTLLSQSSPKKIRPTISFYHFYRVLERLIRYS